MEQKIKAGLYKVLASDKPSVNLYSLFLVLFLAACGTPSGMSTSPQHLLISGSSSSGDLVVNRFQLDFGKGKSSVTVLKGKRVRPVATLKYQGVGILNARWLVDGQVIEQVNILLNRGSLLTLSPKSTTSIPSFVLGKHAIRLQITKPLITFTQPEASFFVVAN